METVLYITIPALMVLITSYFLLDKLLKSEDKRRNFEIQKNNTSAITSVRLRAYERLTLVLERTTPNKLVLKIIKPSMSCFELQTQLLQSIREEFDHNVSQQIYISNELWHAVVSTRESLIQLITGCATQLQPQQPATELAEMLIRVYANTTETPGEIAMKILKAEVRTLF